jgi:hypothetical protein
MHAGMQAFILGTFDTLHVRRTAGGKATVSRVRRIGFVPFPTEKLPWKRSHAVGTTASHDTGVFSWMVCAYLLLLGIVPGVIFYFMVIRPDRYEVTFCDVYGGTDTVAFRGQSRDVAMEIAEGLAEVTGLWWRKDAVDFKV